MRKILSGLIVSLISSASFAQSVITFDVEFHTVYAASGSFAPNLVATAPGPFNNNDPIPDVNLSGQVTLSTVVSSNQLAPAPAVNSLTLNGSWTSESGNEPSNTWSTHTYNDAVFDFGNGFPGGYVATDFVQPVDWPLIAGTGANGIMSDHGPASNYGGTCPFFFGCLSANPFETMAGGTLIFDATLNGGLGGAALPTFADAGNHALTSGTYTPGNVSAGLGSDNGLDSIAFDFTLLGGQVPGLGGTVRFAVFSDTGTTAYMVEGTIVDISGGDITEAGDVGGVGQVALTVDDVTSGVGVDIINASTGAVASTIEYFDVSASTWDLIAIDTVADANSNGTADDPAIALLAQSQGTGQIVVQTRAVSDGSIVGGWLPFFNNSNWTPIDVAVVNDVNGDGTTGDTGIAVLAENNGNGSYQVRMKLLSNGSQTFKRNFFDASWTADAIEGFTAAGGGGSRIAVMAVDGGGRTKAQVRDVSNGNLDISVFAFGSAISGSDLGVIADGDDDGNANDPALLFYGSRVSNGNTIYRSRSAASGSHIKTKELLGTGFTPDAVTSLDSAGASSADDIAGTAVDGSDVQTIKVRDYRNNLTVSDILP